MMVSDFHSHILPRIDDGSSSLEESLELLRLEKEQNVPLVVATPHFYAHQDTMDHFLRKREWALQQLQAAMADHPELPQIKLGAEVYFFQGISETAALRDLAIEGTDCVLIEMPMNHWTDRMYQELAQIPDRQGLQPIIAHIDRYIAPFRRNSHVARMEEQPVLIQANASFFLHRSTRSLALRMLAADRIQFLGSDCHNLEHRPPNLAEAAMIIQKKLGDGPIQRVRHWERSCLDTRL